AAIVPSAFRRAAIDIAADRIAAAELITDRNVVPAAARGEAGVACPAVPVVLHALAIVRIAEKERDMAAAVLAHQPQRPILIFGSEALIARSPLADDVNLLAAGDLGRVDPRFERDCVAVGEIERAIGSRVVVAERRRLVEYD